MRKAIFKSLFTLILIIPGLRLFAQDSLRVVPGTRVRVSSPVYVSENLVQETRDGRFVGNVVSINADTLVVKARGWDGPVAFPLDYVEKVEVSLGKKTKTRRGAGMGLLVGAGFGALVGAVVPEGICYMDDVSDPDCRGGLVALGAASFGLLGTIIGAVAGSRSSQDLWQEALLDDIRKAHR